MCMTHTYTNINIYKCMYVKGKLETWLFFVYTVILNDKVALMKSGLNWMKFGYREMKQTLKSSNKKNIADL